MGNHVNGESPFWSEHPFELLMKTKFRLEAKIRFSSDARQSRASPTKGNRWLIADFHDL